MLPVGQGPVVCRTVHRRLPAIGAARIISKTGIGQDEIDTLAEGRSAARGQRNFLISVYWPLVRSVPVTSEDPRLPQNQPWLPSNAATHMPPSPTPEDRRG